jgi:hypothetical protein
VKAEAVNQRQLVNVIGVALLPEPMRNAEIVLGELHPVSDAKGFAAETRPFEISDAATQRLVMNTLGAGATIPGSVHRDDGRYFVSTDLYKTLLLMRAAAIPAFAPEALQRRLAASGGGALRSEPPQALEGHAIRQIEDQRQADRGTAGHGQPEPGPRRAQAQPRQPSSASVAMSAASPITPPPAPIAPQMAEPHVALAQPPPLKPQSSRLASEIRSAIIQYGLHAWTDQEIEAAWRAMPNSALEQAVMELIRRERSLGQRVGQELDDLQERIDFAYQELKDLHAAEPNYLQVLESEAEKLKRLLPVLMMTPAGPYAQIVDEMRRELRTRGGILEDQVGNGRLTPDESALLGRLDNHLYRLRGLSDRALGRNEQLAMLLDEFVQESSVEAWSGRRASEGPLT